MARTESRKTGSAMLRKDRLLMRAIMRTVRPIKPKFLDDKGVLVKQFVDREGSNVDLPGVPKEWR